MTTIKLEIDCGKLTCKGCCYISYTPRGIQYCPLFNPYAIIEDNKRCIKCLNAEVEPRPLSGLFTLSEPGTYRISMGLFTQEAIKLAELEK